MFNISIWHTCLGFSKLNTLRKIDQESVCYVRIKNEMSVHCTKEYYSVNPDIWKIDLSNVFNLSNAYKREREERNIN